MADDIKVTDLGQLLNDASEAQIAQTAAEAATENVLARLSAQGGVAPTGGGGMILGKVGLTLAGSYAASRSYERLDVVLASGGSYASRHDTNKGHPVTDGKWWQPLCVPPDLSNILNRQERQEEKISALQRLVETARSEQQETASAFADFRDNERITGVEYDAGGRLLSLVRGEADRTSLAPLAVELPCATREAAGLMSAADKRTLDETADNQRWRQAKAT